MEIYISPRAVSKPWLRLTCFIAFDRIIDWLTTEHTVNENLIIYHVNPLTCGDWFHLSGLIPAGASNTSNVCTHHPRHFGQKHPLNGIAICHKWYMWEKWNVLIWLNWKCQNLGIVSGWHYIPTPDCIWGYTQVYCVYQTPFLGILEYTHLSA